MANWAWALPPTQHPSTRTVAGIHVRLAGRRFGQGCSGMAKVVKVNPRWAASGQAGAYCALTVVFGRLGRQMSVEVSATSPCA